MAVRLSQKGKVTSYKGMNQLGVMSLKGQKQ
jgi:hypothetical protein